MAAPGDVNPPDAARGLAARLRALVRAREVGLVGLAVVVGVLAGIGVTAISRGAELLHHLLYGAPRISSLPAVPTHLLLWPAVGGLIMGGVILALKRWRPHSIVDPIEANALHGGRMSLTDSVILSAQTMLANGFGASVGMEAGYTQTGSGIASKLGQWLRLRRMDMRVLVGCGAAGGIAAAFQAPLTGAFYGFELIIGVYAIPAAAPVMASALVAYLTASQLGAISTPITVPPTGALDPSSYLPFLLLGLIAGVVSIGIMRLVTLVEQGFVKSGLPAWLRPAVGGLGVGVLAYFSPQVLSSGEGALHINIGTGVTSVVLLVLVLKVCASALSLGSGFRGGLFFSSLFMGSMLGKLYAGGVEWLVPGLGLDPVIAAVVGMGALAVGVVGGPFTMTFLTLEITGDLHIAGIVLTASIACSLLVRETFGYSFSTWRMHLRGETIRSALDIGWLRALTVERMMRPDVAVFGADADLIAFRAAFPLGAAKTVVLHDAEGRYAGLVTVAEAYYGDLPPETRMGTLAHLTGEVLLPDMNVKEAAAAFHRTQSETLAVVDNPVSRHVVGLLGEAFVLRRYAEELDKARRDVAGDR
ncbi:chloride channel protein [Azorhizobium oxalatiphilum]|uniref:Chloride channel protein n=1 Tax=Azorhizobium oxalatiphilum TaxID=980631 RepID=A0A917C6R0_9HYPH|nr:chloride channel protein [Azorhizobium oxalatiphilum]GGF73455.1 chloride channel protein [Azorhizobium oxalatiphilum]